LLFEVLSLVAREDELRLTKRRVEFVRLVNFFSHLSCPKPGEGILQFKMDKKFCSLLPGLVFFLPSNKIN